MVGVRGRRAFDGHRRMSGRDSDPFLQKGRLGGVLCPKPKVGIFLYEEISQPDLPPSGEHPSPIGEADLLTRCGWDADPQILNSNVEGPEIRD
jgi:hypothetical protein